MKVFELVKAKDTSLQPGDVALRFSGLDFQCLGTKQYESGDEWLTLSDQDALVTVNTGSLYCYKFKNRWQFRIQGQLESLWMTSDEILDALELNDGVDVVALLKDSPWPEVKAQLWDSHFAATAGKPVSIADLLDTLQIKKKKNYSWTLSKDGVSYGSV